MLNTPPEGFATLAAFVDKTPGARFLSAGFDDERTWWMKMTLDIDHPLAWNVVQEYGHVLNLISIEEPLPAAFLPVSPPPYMNGGPSDFLSWVIEGRHPDFTPDLCAQWLEGRLPRPVEDLNQWPEPDE